MSSKKPKLSPESVRALLGFELQRAIIQKSVPKAQIINASRQRSKMFKFFKMLSISKSFLISSRKANCDVYRLMLQFSQHSGKIQFQLASKEYDYSYRGFVDLPFERFKKLVGFLKPSHIGANIEFCVGEEQMEKLIEIFNSTNGKIAFSVDDRSKKEHDRTLMEQFSTRIHELKCCASFLDTEELAITSCFDHLIVKKIENPGQIAQVLRYNVKKLSLNISEKSNVFHFGAGDLIKVDENKSIMKLSLKCSTLNCDAFKSLFKNLHKLCPKSKQFNVKATFNHGQISPDQIPNQVVSYVEEIQGMKDDCGPSNISIDMIIEFDSNEDDDDWIEKIRQNTKFSDWRFDEEEDFYLLDEHQVRLNMTSNDPATFKVQTFVKSNRVDSEPEEEMYGFDGGYDYDHNAYDYEYDDDFDPEYLEFYYNYRD